MVRKRLLILLLFSPLLVVIISATVYLLKRGASPSRPAPAGVVPALSRASQSGGEPVLIEHTIKITRGKTLADILGDHGFSNAEVETLKKAVRPVYNLARVVAGRELRLYLDADLKAQRLEYDINEDSYLAIRRQGATFAAEVKPFPYEVRTALVWGTIEDTPIGAFNKAGEGDLLAMDFAEIFAWDVDFYIDPRKGDTFRLLVQKKYLGQKFITYGDILAAEYLNGRKLYRAFRFREPDSGRADYYDASGGSLRKEFMKSPLKYGRITSRFTASRFHPILKAYTSHYAVDYAAGLGTPVRATAPGKVMFAGWNGGAGRMIHLRHKGGYETMYLHLSGLAEGVAAKAEVDAGQVIGFVGSTGESTGPHLDYRITYHGRYINPLGYRFKPADPLRKEFLAEFKGRVQAYQEMLNWPLRAMACGQGVN